MKSGKLAEIRTLHIFRPCENRALTVSRYCATENRFTNRTVGRKVDGIGVPLMDNCADAILQRAEREHRQQEIIQPLARTQGSSGMS